MFHDDAREHTAPVPIPLPVPPAAAPSRRPKGIDRGAAARMLVEGRSIAEVARAVGCSRQNLWRQVQRSKRLGRMIRSAEEESRTDAYGKLARLAPVAVDTLQRAMVDDGNANVALGIAQRMNLFERPAVADPIRGEAANGWERFTTLLAVVTRRATAASRGRTFPFTSRDFETFWNEAVKEMEAQHLPPRLTSVADQRLAD